jgi:hypothetical protein
MRLQKLAMMAACLAPIVSQAGIVVSTCQTITAVDSWLASGTPAIYLILSPGISGCAAITSGSVGYVVGQNGVTSANINELLAMSLTAFVQGRQVMIGYDSATLPNCNSQLLMIGGEAGQCP